MVEGKLLFMEGLGLPGDYEVYVVKSQVSKTRVDPDTAYSLEYLMLRVQGFLSVGSG